MDYDVSQGLPPAIQALFTSVVLIAMGSALFFKFIPVTMERTQKYTVFYFMLFFFCIFSSFVLASLVAFIPYALVSILTGMVYVVGYYALLQGLIIRQTNQVKHFHTKLCFYFHLLMFVGVSLYLFYSKYFGLSGELSRIAFLTTNLLGICLFAITKICKNPDKPTRGEYVARFAFVAGVVLMLVTMAALVFTKDLESYLVIAVPIQIFNLHIVVLSLCSLLLSDSINKHYENSMKDPLTGVANRRYFIQEVGQMIDGTTSPEKLGSMIVADIDYFKKINDRYGHDVGDKAIIAFANMLQGSTRSDAHMARLGGEEFVIFLPDINQVNAEAIAERLRVQTHHISVGNHNRASLKITASFGIATFPMAETSIEEYLQAADRAMYDAKDRGRDTISHYNNHHE